MQFVVLSLVDRDRDKVLNLKVHKTYSLMYISAKNILQVNFFQVLNVSAVYKSFSVPTTGEVAVKFYVLLQTCRKNLAIGVAFGM
jgi:hypothetical protein